LLVTLYRIVEPPLLAVLETRPVVVGLDDEVRSQRRGRGEVLSRFCVG